MGSKGTVGVRAEVGVLNAAVGVAVGGTRVEVAVAATGMGVGGAVWAGVQLINKSPIEAILRGYALVVLIALFLTWKSTQT